MMKKENRKPSDKSNALKQDNPGKNADHPFARYKRAAGGKKNAPGPSHPSRYKTGNSGRDKNNAGNRNSLYAPFKPYAPAVIFPLNKYLAYAGVCARRKAVEYIKAGEVNVNGKIITAPGFKVTEKDTVRFKGKKLLLRQTPVYILLNKPKGYLTTTDDPRERKTVMDLITKATAERVYPVGRLDRNTSGLLLLTNDGELAQQLAHPSHNIQKVYHVTLDRPLTNQDFDRIREGIELEDGRITPDSIAYTDIKDKTQIGLEIHSGRNRVVRRIFEHLGYEVRALDRVLYAGLTKKNIPRGKWRMLTEKEIRVLKHFTPKNRVTT
jgi:23S rRNA pseudouridine2605 synthase